MFKNTRREEIASEENGTTVDTSSYITIQNNSSSIQTLRERSGFLQNNPKPELKPRENDIVISDSHLIPVADAGRLSYNQCEFYWSKFFDPKMASHKHAAIANPSDRCEAIVDKFDVDTAAYRVHFIIKK